MLGDNLFHNKNSQKGLYGKICKNEKNVQNYGKFRWTKGLHNVIIGYVCECYKTEEESG